MAMRSRGRLSDRIKSLTEKGGSPEAEDAVQRALRWLANVQNKDGSWGSSYPVAMTGYAVLCFLGHGDTPDSATYGPVVRRGVEFLTQTSAKNTGLMASKPGTNGACYEHGIATYALGEVYAMARFGQKDMGLVIDSFEKGVQIILRGQTEAGGWLYNYNPGSQRRCVGDGLAIPSIEGCQADAPGLPDARGADPRKRSVFCSTCEAREGALDTTHLETRRL
jgi:hypothetical protein